MRQLQYMRSNGGFPRVEPCSSVQGLPDAWVAARSICHTWRLQIGPAIAVRSEVYLAWNKVGMATCTPTLPLQYTKVLGYRCDTGDHQTTTESQTGFENSRDGQPHGKIIWGFGIRKWLMWTGMPKIISGVLFAIDITWCSRSSLAPLPPAETKSFRRTEKGVTSPCWSTAWSKRKIRF